MLRRTTFQRLALELGDLLPFRQTLRHRLAHRWGQAAHGNTILSQAGSNPSLHARGAAIDLCAAGNDNLAHWPDAASMPLDVMATFAREGWLPAGARAGAAASAHRS